MTGKANLRVRWSQESGCLRKIFFNKVCGPETAIEHSRARGGVAGPASRGDRAWR